MDINVNVNEELRDRNKALKRELEQVKTERDALAASLADVKLTAKTFAPGFAAEMERRCPNLDTALSRRKAEWQAEALELAAEQTVPVKYAHKLLNRAKAIRRQAEGGQ